MINVIYHLFCADSQGFSAYTNIFRGKLYSSIKEYLIGSLQKRRLGCRARCTVLLEDNFLASVLTEIEICRNFVEKRGLV